MTGDERILSENQASTTYFFTKKYSFTHGILLEYAIQKFGE